MLVINQCKMCDIGEMEAAGLIKPAMSQFGRQGDSTKLDGYRKRKLIYLFLFFNFYLFEFIFSVEHTGTYLVYRYLVTHVYIHF